MANPYRASDGKYTTSSGRGAKASRKKVKTSGTGTGAVTKVKTKTVKAKANPLVAARTEHAKAVSAYKAHQEQGKLLHRMGATSAQRQQWANQSVKIMNARSTAEANLRLARKKGKK